MIPSRRAWWYNWFSPEERNAATPIQQAAIRSGAIPKPTTCSICGHTPGPGSDNPVWLHDEDYEDPLAAFHVCRRCHLTLHRRFDQPGPWLALVQANRRGDGDRWFERLTMDPASIHQPFELTYPSGLADYPHDPRDGASPS